MINPQNTTHPPRQRNGRWGRRLAASLTLGVALLSQMAQAQNPVAGSYGAYVLTQNPVAFWQLNETNDPSTGIAPAYDVSGNGRSGTYGTTALNAFDGIVGPQPPTYIGFVTNQGALQTTSGDINSSVALPPLNLNTNPASITTNGVTIALWINPNGTVVTYAGLLMNRTTSGDAAGFGFGGSTSADTGATELGYTWNNNSGATYDFNSGLYPINGIWQLAVLVVASNSATIYLDYIDPTTGQPVLLSAVNPIAHTAEAFASGGIYLGSDVNQNNVSAANNPFTGGVADAAVFNSAFTADQVLALFSKGVGVQGFAPQITGQPQSAFAIAGASVQISATGINGTSPITYQWKLNGTDVNALPDSTNFIGATSNVLTIASATAKDAGSYQLFLNNAVGSAVSSNAVLTLQTPALVGEWLDGSPASTNFLDVSGYSLAANHDAYLIGGGNFVFTNDVPSGKSGQSLLFYNGDTGLAISNSSTLDGNYDSTFDNVINNAYTVSVWSKGWPTTWSPFVSKFGETESGWQLRAAGSTSFSCFTVRNGGAGSGTNYVNVGTTSYGAADDLSTTTIPSNDGNWHLYVGVFNAATGVRSLYVDGILAANETGGNTPYVLAAAEHLCLGAKDSPPGNTFANFSTLQLFDARVYNYAITQAQVEALYGVIPAVVNGQPLSQAAFAGSTANLSAVVGGTQPISYQWQFNGTNLVNGTGFSGVNSNVLSILNMSTNDVGSYQLVVKNAYGTAVSSNALVTIKYRYLVGEWFNGSSSLADVSGYQPAGTHDGFDAAGTGGYAFTNDVPAGRSGQALILNGTTGIAINNSSTLDANYTNTFDDPLNSAVTVAFWAKGWPGGWNPFVSKNGDSGTPNAGWDLRNDGNNNVSPCWTIRGAGGNVTQGTAVYGNPEDMAATGITYGNDGKWHHYAGVYSAATGIRTLYVDGVPAANETGNTLYNLANYAHVVIGGIDHSPGNTLTAYFSGKFFDVRIYNYDLASNQVAQLAALPDPAITAQPVSLTTYVGKTATLGASIHGTAPVSTQWQFNGTNLVDGAYDGATISGSGSTALTIANVTINNQGAYTLVVSNQNGQITSHAAILTVLQPVAAPAANLVGAWLSGPAKLADTSGYQPAGTHDAYGVIGSGVLGSHFVFTNDVPGASGESLWFQGNSALVISNSATVDANYTNTFDDTLTNAFTLTFWAKGWPGSWNPFVSKYGEGPGWQLRNDGNNNVSPAWTVRGNAGTVDLGTAVYGNAEDMAATSITYANDGKWHHYAGVCDTVAGIRSLYEDGNLVAQQTGAGQYNISPGTHLMIGGKDSTGSSFGNYFTGLIYDVRIYDTALSEAQVNYVLLAGSAQPSVPAFSGPPVLVTGPNGSHLVLTWTTGSLLQSTNLAGPWAPTGATSPYTNNLTWPEEFFKLSNP